MAGELKSDTRVRFVYVLYCIQLFLLWLVKFILNIKRKRLHTL